VNAPVLKHEHLLLCPECASAAVDASPLASGEARCRGCGFFGRREELFTIPIAEGPFGSEGALTAMLSDLRRIFSEGGTPYLRFLLKWGFIEADANRLLETLDRRAFSRYLAAIARGVLVAIVEERNRIETGRDREAASDAE
jgi:hypothetical protein